MKKAIVWLFTKATDSRNLLRFSKDVIVISFDGQVRVNPLTPPPGVETSFWINCFADLFIQAFGLYDGTKNFLIQNLNYLFQRNCKPTIHDLYRLIKAQSFPLMSRDARYKESALNRLGGMLCGSLGKTFGFPYMELADLADNDVIFEIQGLTVEQQVFVVNVLLTWLFYDKLYNDNDKFHVVGIDDANLVFDKSFENRPDRGQPIISHLMSTVRKSRIFIIVCSQIPHQLGASVHSNSFTKIMFSLANGRDVECMTKNMGIRDPEQQQYCHKLSQREVIVKFAGRYQEPFLGYVPEVDLFNNVITNEEISLNNDRILATIQLTTAPEPPTVVSESEVDENELSPEEKAFLWDVYNRPFVSVTERYRTIDIGG